MARQFKVYDTGWEDAILIVGWDPALGTYYAQIHDSGVEEYGPVMWLTPKGNGIQDVDELVEYINDNIRGRWKPISLNRLFHDNLKWDKDLEGGYHNNIPKKANIGIRPADIEAYDSYPNTQRVCSNMPEEYKYTAMDLCDWFFENYEDPKENTPVDSKTNCYVFEYGGPYRASDVIKYYWSYKYPSEVINHVLEEIKKLNVKGWAPAQWRIEALDELDD